MNNDEDYTYESSGLDGFLSRSIDDLSQVNLGSQGPQSTAQAFDRTQVTGVVGDKMRIGNSGQSGELTGEIQLQGKLKIGDKITIDGEEDKISMEDNDQKEFLSFRTFPDGTQGFIIVKEGFSVSDVVDG